MKRIHFIVLVFALLLCACKKEIEMAPLISLDKTSYSFEAKGGSGNVVFSSNSEWTAKSSESWLSVSPSSGPAGDNISITLSAQANSDYGARTATVVLTSGDVSQRISVTQAQNEGFVLTEHDFSIGSKGGEISIPVRANIDYTCAVAEDAKPWLSVTKTKSLADYRITVNVAANDGYDQRTGTLTVSYDGKSETVTITQSQLDEMLVGTTSFEIGSEGGDISVPVSTNVEYVAEVLGTAGDWLSVKTVRTKGLEECRLVLSVSKNNGYDGRVGQVKVCGAGKESVVTVTQSQLDELVVSQTSFEIGSNGGVIAVPVSSNCEYSYEVLGGASWLSIEKNETKGLVDSNVCVAVQKNETYDARVGQIKIAGAGKESVVTITQSQLDEMIVGTTAFEIGSDGGTIKVPVSANIEYSAELLGNAKDWIKISSVQTKALEEYFLVLTIDKNEGYDARTGQIRLTGAGKESVITVTQSQKDEILIENKSLQIGKEGGNLEVSFQTNCEYRIAVLGDAQSWLSVTGQPETKGLATRSFSVSVAANESYDNRVGQIKVYGDRAESVITVNQNQTNGLNLSKTVYEIECEGGSVTVEYKANVDVSCEIEESAREWLSLVTTKGLSAGSLSFSVKKNESINDREAKITLKAEELEQEITIRQFADKSLKIIEFADEYAKSACIRNFDANGDGDLSVKEAEMATRLPSDFLTQTERNKITSFNELRYFKNLRFIDYECFRNCFRLTSIVVPNECSAIHSYAFEGCTKLESLNLQKGVSHVGGYAFKGCSSLVDIVFLEGSTGHIGEYAFYECSSLTRVNIPESVKYIGAYTFYKCSSLTCINIPEGVTSIGEYAFSYCSSLMSVNIPKGVTSIRKNTFYKCSSLTSINIPEGVRSIEKQAFFLCTSLTSINIPEGVRSIGSSAFQYCSNLTSVVIPEGVTSIENYTFSSCIKLASINIPEGVTSIGSEAFYACSSLTSFVIPEGVSSIGASTFSECSGLECVTVKPETPPIVSLIFRNTPSTMKIYVPAESVDDYKSANGWSSYASQIFPIQ